MKKIITKAVCLLCAGALVLGAAGCSKSADSSSAASSTAAAVYGSAEDYDYENFSYSSGLDENGYWEGVKALDYVTLPENFASLTFKRAHRGGDPERDRQPAQRPRHREAGDGPCRSGR